MLVVVPVVLAQPPPVLTILSPPDESYVSGVVPIRASVSPPDSVVSVSFMVDGRRVCVVTHQPFHCDWDAGPAVKEYSIRVTALLKSGVRLSKTARTRDAAFAENVDVDVVQVTATVTDGRGRFVRGLPKSAFKVLEDDRAQTITHFTFEGTPPELVVAVDMSSSISESIPKVKTAVTELLNAIPPSVRVTLLGFNDSVFTLARHEVDPAARAKAVQRLAPWGATSLYDVVIKGVDLLGRQTGRKALLVFSDGEDTASRATLEEVERRLQETEAVVYAIGQGRGVSLDKLKKVLQQLSRPTGGRALFTERIDELKDAFSEILDELSNQYLLGYPPINATRDGSWRKIKVEVTGGYDIRARSGYRASAR